ncbi:hypothetical protein BDR05DRAFT_88724 [Suillus weaverae]|nr:hypothetical protein BDR05DRAFT_88724 [Suillus weaverae]
MYAGGQVRPRSIWPSLLKTTDCRSSLPAQSASIRTSPEPTDGSCMHDKICEMQEERTYKEYKHRLATPPSSVIFRETKVVLSDAKSNRRELCAKVMSKEIRNGSFSKSHVMTLICQPGLPTPATHMGFQTPCIYLDQPHSQQRYSTSCVQLVKDSVMAHIGR